MPDFAVSTMFKAKDYVSKAFSTMAKGADRFGNRADKAFRRASRSGGAFKSVVGGILTAGAVQRGLGLLEQGLGNVARGFVEFDGAAIGATARFKDIGPEAKNFDLQLQTIKKSARDAGAVTEYTAAQSAKALDFLARAGFKSAEAMGGLRSMINLATATGEEFAQAADYSSDLLGAFGLNADNTAQKIANLNRLNDVLTKTANSSNVSLENMFEAMKTAGPIAKGLGISLETVSAITGVLGDSGIKGTEAGTVMKNSFLNLATQKKPVVDMLNAIGVAVDDGTGNFRGINNILADMGDKLKGLGQIKQAKVLDAVFGKRAIAGASNLIENVSRLKEFNKELINASGTADATAERLRKSWGNRLLALGSAATEAGFKVFDAFDNKGKKGIDALTQAVRNFDIAPIISGIKTTAKVVKTLYNVIEPFIPILPVLIGGMLAYSAAIKIGAFISFISVLQKAAVAQGILNAVMTANPIGAVIMGITALVAAGVLIYKHWDKVKIVFARVWKALDNPIIATIATLMAPMITIPILIAKHWDKVKAVFMRVWKALDNPIVRNIAYVLAPFMAIPIAILKNWEPVKDFFVSLFEKVSALTNKLNIGGLMSKVGGWLGFDGDQAQGAPQMVAPNRAEVEARQQVNFNGRIDIAGAPQGTTAKSKTSGAPPIRMDVVGANS